MKALASDFDGTLHFVDEEHKGYFKKEDLDAIQTFQKEGNLFGLCTGRPLLGFEGDLEGGPSLDFIIASTGGIVTTMENNEPKTLYEETITYQQVADIQELCEGRGNLYIHADGRVYTLYTRKLGYDSQTVLSDVKELDGKHITAISVWTPSLEEAAVLTDDINQTFKGTIDAYQNQNWLDVIHYGVSKGKGALKLKDATNIDIIAGIGDSFNDIPLLEKVDVSFTFHSSDDRVKEKADYIVDTVAEALDILNKM